MSEHAHTIVIGLGSNLGDRAGYMRQAIELLSVHMRDIKQSCVYASPAMLPDNAPHHWDTPFLNMAICGNTTLSPQAWLAHIRDAEHKIGRKRIAHWGPREIDIDILAYDQLVLDDAQLRIPHPGLAERAFVLMPMCDIVPSWIYPRPSIHQGRTISEITRELLGATHQCTLYNTQLANISQAASANQSTLDD